MLEIIYLTLIYRMVIIATQSVSSLMCFYVIAQSWVFQSMYHCIWMPSQTTYSVTLNVH